MFFRDRESDVLRAVNRLGPDCTASAVQGRLTEEDGREASFGRVFSGLDRLVAKGEVAYRAGEPDPARGGRAPRLYTVTRDGTARLTEEMRASLARDPGRGGRGVLALVPARARRRPPTPR